MLQNKQYLILPILIFLICIIFYPVLFQGKIFSTPDSLNPKAAAIIIEESRHETGEYPMWQPWIFSGMPAAESFTNTSNIYFPNYIFTLLNIPASIVHILHFLVAGLGVYVLLRHLKISQYVAIICALGFMLMPYLVTMEVFGHGSQAMTTAYIPWAFWAAIKLFDRKSLFDVGILALILGLQLQRAHVQIAYYTWMLIGAYYLYRIILLLIEKKRINAAKLSGLFFVSILIALGISALVYLPSLQYSAESIRSVGQSGSASYDYATSWSLHPKEMLTFLLPSAFGFGGQTYWGAMPFTDYPNYMGIIFLILSIVAIIKSRDKLVWFLGTTTILGLLISFGSHFSPVYNLFYNFAPYFNKFRIPSMILIIVQFNVIVLASIGLEKIVNKDSLTITKYFWWMVGIIGFITIILLFASDTLRDMITQGFIQPMSQDPRVINFINNLRWDMWYRDAWLFIILIFGFLTSYYLLANEKINKFVFVLIIGGLAITDLYIVDQKIVNPEENSGRASQLVSKKAIDRYFNHDDVTSSLTNFDGEFRVYPIGRLFGESRLQAFGIESVGGYHPAKLAIYNRFLQNTNNISTLPLMRMMNVHYILSMQAINHPELTLLFTENMQTGAGRLPIWVYELNNHLERAWFVNEVQSGTDENELWRYLMSDTFDPEVIAYTNIVLENNAMGSGRVLTSQYDPNNITLAVSSESEGFLVVSEVHYPLRWQAYIDGDIVPTYETNGVLRGLIVPEGEHVIEFKYDKSNFRRGVLISIVSSLLSISLITIGLIIQRK